MFTVYILYSPTLDKFYKGQTSKLNERLFRHNNGYEKFTKKGIPWILIWKTNKKSRALAMQLETKLQNLGRGKTIEFILKYENDIVGPDELLLVKQLSGC